MDRFHQLKVYVAVAEEEGFAAAARRLQLSPPAVTRAVAALEDTLGVKLLDRTTRYVRATEAGRRYLEDARSILAGLEAADEPSLAPNPYLSLRQAQQLHILRVLKQVGGNKSMACRILGIGRGTLYKKLEDEPAAE